MSDDLSDVLTDEYVVMLPDGMSKGWAVGPRRSDDPGFDWGAHGPVGGKLEFEFGACPGDATPERAIREAQTAYERRFKGA